MARMRRGYLWFASILFLTIPAGIARAVQQSAPNNEASKQTQKPAASGQEQRETVYESATVLRTTSRLVVVDVVATDNKDRAIPDLKREDFSILEEGKPQRIAAFSFQQPSQALTAESSRAVPKLPENIFSNIPQFKSPGSLNVVLLDALNTTVPHQAYVRQQMIKYLEKMPEGRPVAVYALGTKLTLLQDFTTDPTALKNVIKKMKLGVSPLLDNPAGGQDVELLPAGAADSGLVSADMLQAMIAFEQDRTAFQTDIRVAYTLDALGAIARSLAGYPGRKNLIWISEAFPLSIDPDLQLTADAFASTRNYAPQVAATEDMLIDAQIAIYSIDARGLENYSAFDASNSGRDKFGRSMGRNPALMTNAMNQQDAALQNAHATMQDMATRTGGRAFYNRNDIDTAIGKSMDDGSTYYTLAYYPENKDWNGKFRKIQVKVGRPGVKLRHRQGYFALDPTTYAQRTQKQKIDDFAQALSLESPSATGLRFHAGVVQPSERTKNKLLVNFGIDPHAISFDKQSDGLEHANIDCVVLAYTEKAKLLKTETSTMNAQLKPDTFVRVMQTVFPCQDYIDLPPGSYLLRLGVRDNRTGLIGTTMAKVTITSSAASPPEDKNSSAPSGSSEKKP